MRFVDEAIIFVQAGNGGKGCVSFRREKFIPRGGPDGGNGGDGGSVVFRASGKLLSLYDFRVKRRYQAENGKPGEGSQRCGRKGKDYMLALPAGTQVYEITPGGERLFADLAATDEEVIAARGGRGGKGNEHFTTSTNRAPRFAQPGEEGEGRTFRLELKILADCGLLGLPNAGKSTFLGTVSAARPKVAAYPFTTLAPNLGIMLEQDDCEKRMVIADMPGLIEGAATGAGLGHRFLRHVERTRFLLHMLSIEDMDADDPFAGFDLINAELALFAPALSARPQLQAVSKTDLAEAGFLAALRQRAEREGRELFFFSSLSGEGLEALQEAMWRHMSDLARNEALVHVREPVEDDDQSALEDDPERDAGNDTR